MLSIPPTERPRDVKQEGSEVTRRLRIALVETDDSSARLLNDGLTRRAIC